MGTPIGVLGAGAFGTCLAMLCARTNDVVLWARDPEVSEAINRKRRNPRYLSEFEIPASVRATTDLATALADRELVICAIPSHGLRPVLADAGSHLPGEVLLVSTVKGIEVETGMLMHEVFEDVLDPIHHPRIVILSGPSFAKEIAARKPTVVTLACRSEAFAISVQSTLSCPWFRCYTSTDVTGVELGGALKNVVAIAVGISDGLELGHNARAALMTRGLAEVARLGLKLGVNPITFMGLSGMGDLLLTCTGDLSRNRRVGLELGRGKALEEILAEMNGVAEGVRTTRATVALARRLQVEMPIADMVDGVLDGARKPADAVEELMTRQLKSEIE